LKCKLFSGQDTKKIDKTLYRQQFQPFCHQFGV
jgi:hypothetical protein